MDKALEREAPNVPVGTVSIAFAAKRLGISRSAAYGAAHDGTIPTIKIGRRLLVAATALEKLIREGQPKAAGGVS